MDYLSTPPSSYPYVSVAAASLLLCLVTRAVYRLYFSPIASFPGPKLAALTFWYEFYYDVIQRGQMTFRIRDMHKQYGPIVRISPAEIHVETPSFADELYSTSRRRDKWERFTRCFGIPDSVFTTVDHDVHRMRRAALNPFFSTASVRRLQPVIEERLDRLLERFAEFQETGETMAVNMAYAAYTNDVAMQYAFARCEHRIEAKDFDPSFHDASMVGSALGQFMKQFPWVIILMQALPDWVAVLLNKDMASYVKLQRDIKSQVKAIQSGTYTLHKTVSHPTIFHEILNSKLPPAEKSFDRLWQDGQVTVVAGTLTTAWALSVTHYHLLATPSALKKLKTELVSAIPDPSVPVPLASLEQLPYLSAVIQESLRLSCGVSTRLQRIAPDEAMRFTDPISGRMWTIPPGTPVSMTGLLMQLDERYFPDPLTFRPERWLEKNARARLEKYCLPFSKGSRQCVGMGLAYAEIFLAMARIWRVYGSQEVKGEGDRGTMRLWGTDVRDVTIVGDATTPLVWRGTKGVRVVFG